MERYYEIRHEPYNHYDKMYLNTEGRFREGERMMLIKAFNRAKKNYAKMSPRIFLITEEEVTWGL